MAVITKISLKNHFTAGFERFTDVFVNFIVSISTVKNRFLQFESLSEMTATELTASGLKREDVVCHVFWDAYYV